MWVAAVAVLAEIASESAKADAQVSAARARDASLELQGKEQTIQYQQKSLSNYDVMNKVLQAQEAQMTVRGTAFSSPSFNALQRDTLNIGAKTQKNLDTTESLEIANVENEKGNVQASLYADIFGDVSEGVSEVSGTYSKMPSTNTSKMPSLKGS